MGLRDILKSRPEAFEPGKGGPPRRETGPTTPAPPSPSARAYTSIKNKLHQRILEEIDIRRFHPARDLDAFRSAVRDLVDRTLEESPLPLSKEGRERVAKDVVEEAIGLGPLGPLFADPAISDILVNGPDHVYIERFGRLQKTDIRFSSEDHLLRLIERIVARVGRHIDQHNPLVDARLPDGSRVNAIIPPLSLVGPVLSIRRFGHGRFSADDLIRFGTMTPVLRDLLEGLVRTRHNLLVSGGTGSGKTTLLNVLSGFVSPDERIVTIEDAAELRLQQEHVVRLESRPPNVEGKGAVTIRDLVINALRMRPDRIIVGEVRAGEAFDMLQAMTTGHDGGMSTIHANSPQDALKRLETMVLMAGFDLPSRAIRELIVSAINVIVHVDRMQDGSRKIVQLTEIAGIERGTILTQDIVTFETAGFRENRVLGDHVATGVRPAFMQKLGLHGYAFEPGLFRKGRRL